MSGNAVVVFVALFLVGILVLFGEDEWSDWGW